MLFLPQTNVFPVIHEHDGKKIRILHQISFGLPAGTGELRVNKNIVEENIPLKGDYEFIDEGNQYKYKIYIYRDSMPYESYISELYLEGLLISKKRVDFSHPYQSFFKRYIKDLRSPALLFLIIFLICIALVPLIYSFSYIFFTGIIFIVLIPMVINIFNILQDIKAYAEHERFTPASILKIMAGREYYSLMWGEIEDLPIVNEKNQP